MPSVCCTLACHIACHEERRVARKRRPACQQLKCKAPHSPDKRRGVLASERKARDGKIIAEHSLRRDHGAPDAVRGPSLEEYNVLSAAHEQYVGGVQVGALPFAAAAQRQQDAQEQARHGRVSLRPSCPRQADAASKHAGSRSGQGLIELGWRVARRPRARPHLLQNSGAALPASNC